MIYFCVQHMVTWRKEQERVKQAVSVFRILALITLGTTIYLFYFTKSRGMSFGGFGGSSSSENPDLTAPTVADATVETTFFSKLTKLFAMCALVLLAAYRIIRRL